MSIDFRGATYLRNLLGWVCSACHFVLLSGCIFFVSSSRLSAKESIPRYSEREDSVWLRRFINPAAQTLFDISTSSKKLQFTIKKDTSVSDDTYALSYLNLGHSVSEIGFDYKVQGDAKFMPVTLFDAAANRLWHYDGKGSIPQRVNLKNLNVRGQLVFRIQKAADGNLTEGWSHEISNIKLIENRQNPALADGYILLDNLDELRSYASEDNVKIRLKPGVYKIDKALFRHFIEFTGNNTRWDLRGAKFLVDTKLFRQFGTMAAKGDQMMYCALTVAGNNITIEGLNIETFGNQYGVQSRNKIFNITGSNVTLKNIEVRTEGSNPWGYGSLYGIAGGDVRKMNGIRIGWPANEVKLIGCKVHMRAMGHAIFVQGAENTIIEDCHVDGLLRPTSEILAETSGYAFERGFIARNKGYVEGVIVGDDGKILPDEMLSLSEDGIRMYPEASGGHKTGSTTIKNCTVTNMRRGICTGLSTAGDKVINCKVTNCVATGFNVGDADTLINCRADAKYSEALCVPYVNSEKAKVELEILDSRGGMANRLLAKINGEGHEVTLKALSKSLIPKNMVVELASFEGYGPRRGQPTAKNIILINETPAPVVLLPGTELPSVESKGIVQDRRPVK